MQLNVNIQTLLKNSSYEITDYLPSGLKPLVPTAQSFDYNSGSNGICVLYPNRINDNKIYFDYSLNATPYNYLLACNSANTKIIYYARVATPGTFRADPASISEAQNADYISVSKPQIIKINP